MADWAVAQGDVMGCRNSKVLPEPPEDVKLDLVKKVSKDAVTVNGMLMAYVIMHINSFTVQIQ